MVKSAGIENCKLQVTVDAVTDRLIGDIAALGFQGTNKSEVACSILRSWLWENQEKLQLNGVQVTSKKDD